ncbi:aldehyde dehydrogenase family protein [Paenarthrobacter sp. PAE-2]|uniref:aldehyde dehydrogenase family protein n=1 Tax=Paenarthrobacter sp. PAE-2 TaxID=2982532 RepID=UPI0022311B09|nr:aldehyde dehydrogenase family protein [Paenarthrobacter sp. PAE-2]MCW3768645.1 aldehyde dehydrogenase family protein [Paenarthrobacter sp. PAE-2]
MTELETARERRSQEMADILQRPFRMLIGGELRDAASGAVFETFDPYTRQVLAKVPDAAPEDVDAAAAAAAKARVTWKATPLADRVERVRALADIVEAQAEELALLDALDVGATIRNARNDVALAVNQMRIYAGLALELKGQTIPGGDALHLTVREPVGVVAKIFPFNHPLMFACRVAAPLIAGNPCVIKPPEMGPLSALRLGELARDVFPPGVLNIIVGNGPAVPDRLVRHEDVRRIGFIGSESTGRAIQRAAAESGVKQVSLELGGKNAMLVFPDADLKEAARGAVAGMNFMWAGQSCGSTSRLLVHESIHDGLLEEITKLVAEIRLGDPLEDDTTQGTMVSESAQRKTEGFVQMALDDGASLVAGGCIPEGTQSLHFEPTVISGVTPSSRIAQQEVFGPVLSVLKFKTESEAVEIANGVRYGLTGAIWTKDLDRAFRVAGNLETGFIWINGSSAHFPNVPYGGVKASGVGGKEESMEELFSYTEEKVINAMIRR